MNTSFAALSATLLATLSTSLAAETVSTDPAAITASMIVLPANTIVVVTPTEEITSKKMKEGHVHTLMVVNDVIQDGTVVIRRGAPVKATVTWRTGKGIVGKSAKFELTFNSVRAGNRDWALRGKHRQEGRGNTVGALLGSAIITGRSAVMAPGQLINVFTAEEITLQPQRTAVATPQPVQQPAAESAVQSSGLNPLSSVKCITCQ